MASKRPRKIVVNGVEFRWKAGIRAVESERVIEVRAWQIRAGSVLIARLVGKPASYIETAYPTPNDVRIIIECGIAKGWKFGEHGADFHLTSEDKVDLEGLRLI
ncbi:MAG TPA: hypothetical protein VHD90_26100 [Phototrophicaceae bacterium]|nr:hypothetical protein [Phototrophicaceae bacterium]